LETFEDIKSEFMSILATPKNPDHNPISLNVIREEIENHIKEE